MIDFANWFRKTFRMDTLLSRARHRTRTVLRSNRVALGIEVLEDRVVPTTLFLPQFPAPSESPTSLPQDSLKSPQVVMIFAGPYWQTSQGQLDEQTQNKAAQNIVSSTYLSDLQQYGSDGVAIAPSKTPWEDPNHEAQL